MKVQFPLLMQLLFSWAASLCGVLERFNCWRNYGWIFGHKKMRISNPNPNNMELGKEETNNDVFVVIEVDWYFNSRKLALEQKHVALSRETKVALKIWCMSYSTVGITFTIVVLDSPNNHTIQHFWNIVLFFVLNDK